MVRVLKLLYVLHLGVLNGTEEDCVSPCPGCSTPSCDKPSAGRRLLLLLSWQAQLLWETCTLNTAWETLEQSGTRSKASNVKKNSNLTRDPVTFLL